MAIVRLVRFDRPLRDAGLAGRQGRFYTEAEIAAVENAAYQRGLREAAVAAEQQLAAVRQEAAGLAEGVLKRLEDADARLAEQVRDGIPSLALDLAKRLLAGYEPAPEIIARLCHEALSGIFPERDNLELSLSARDAGILESLRPGWLPQYPGLRIRVDAGLRPGDCQVRSRFGLTDARLETKLAALEHSLLPERRDVAA